MTESAATLPKSRGAGGKARNTADSAGRNPKALVLWEGPEHGWFCSCAYDHVLPKEPPDDGRLLISIVPDVGQHHP